MMICPRGEMGGGLLKIDMPFSLSAKRDSR
jgi:hypothetical protein